MASRPNRLSTPKVFSTRVSVLSGLSLQVLMGVAFMGILVLLLQPGWFHPFSILADVQLPPSVTDKSIADQLLWSHWLELSLAFVLGGLFRFGVERLQRWFAGFSDQATQAELPSQLVTEVQLSDVLDHAIASITSFEIDATGHWEPRYYSAGSELVFGYTPEEFLSDQELWTSRLVPDDLQTWLALKPNLLECDRPITFEYRFRHKDGTLRWVAETLNIHPDPIGNYWWATAFSVDITQQKQAEAALLQREEWFRSIFENAGIGVVLTNPNHIPIKTNAAAQRLFGYTDAELCQMPFTQYTHPEDIALDVSLNQELLAGKRTSYQIEKRYFHKSGELVWAKLTVSSARDSSDRPQFTIAMIENISAQRQAEQQLKAAIAEMRALFAAMDELIFVYDRTGRNLRTLAANERLLYLPAEAKTGKTLHEIFPTDLANQFLGYIQQALDTQQTVRTEYCLPIRGEQVWSDAVLSPIDANTVIWTIRDLTQRKQAEAALQKRERYLATLVEVQQCLLDLEDDQQNPYNPILELLGQVSGAFRVYVFENHLDEQGQLLTSQRAEWCASGIASQTENPRLQNVPIAQELPRWFELLSQGEIVAGNVNTFPAEERLALEAQEICSILVLPMQVNGQWFGFIGFDNCSIEKTWEPSEVYLLQAAAAAIALSRERFLINQELRTTNAELKALFGAMNELILVLDGEGRHLKIQSANFDLLYKPKEECLGKTLHEIFPEEQADWFLRHIQTVLRTKQTLNLEYSLPTEGLGEVWSDASVSFIDGNRVVWAIRDVTERKRSEEVIRQSEARFQRLAANLPGVIYRYLLRSDGSDAVTYVSLACQEVYELSPEEILQDVSLIWQRIHPEDVSAIKLAIAESAKTLQPFFWEGRIVTPAGQTRWLRKISRPERQENGDVIWDGLVIDVSDRKQAEFTLKKQAQRERLMTQVTQRIRQTLDLEEILFTTVAEVRQFLQADRVLIYQFNPDWSGNFVAESVAAGWMPILPLESEDLLHQQNTVMDGRCLTRQRMGSDRPASQDPTHQDTYLQDTYLQDTCGGNYIKGISYFCVEDVHQQGFDDCYLELLARFQAKAYITVPIFQNTIQGNILWGLMGTYQNTGPRAWQPDEINFVVNIATQLGVALQQAELLTQTLKQSTELKYAKEAADAANRAKSLFLASMSHELRTPLNAILGFTQLMANDENTTPAQQENLSIINRSGEHLLGLINDVLDMSKIEAGKIVLNERQTNLHELLDTLRETFHFRASAKGIALSFEKSPHITQLIETDDGKLCQILSNLLSNAIKFTETGSVRLSVQQLSAEMAAAEFLSDGQQQQISDSVESASPMMLQFTIQDTGPGMAPDELKNLFNPFVQTETGLRSQQGTGLGLSITKRLVQFLGGEIGVQSERGRGTLFWVKLPVKIAQDSTLLSSDLPQQAIALAPGQPTYRILVVDDAKTNRLLLLRLLEPLGFAVEQAEDGEAAIALWETWQPHLIWMDMQMPRMDGFAATRQIRLLEQAREGNSAAEPHTFPGQKNASLKSASTVIIALTANALAEEREQILATGCNDILNKPFRRQALLQKIAEHLAVQYLYADAPVEESTNHRLSAMPERNSMVQTTAHHSHSVPQNHRAAHNDSPGHGGSTAYNNFVAYSSFTSSSGFAIANFDGLPADWLERVYHAATRADARQLLQLAEALPAHQDALRSVIVTLVQQFRFDLIMDSARQSFR